jgi:hypothetical protein
MWYVLTVEDDSSLAENLSVLYFVCFIVYLMIAGFRLTTGSYLRVGKLKVYPLSNVHLLAYLFFSNVCDLKSLVVLIPHFLLFYFLADIGLAAILGGVVTTILLLVSFECVVVSLSFLSQAFEQRIGKNVMFIYLLPLGIFQVAQMLGFNRFFMEVPITGWVARMIVALSVANWYSWWLQVSLIVLVILVNNLFSSFLISKESVLRS